MRTARHRKPENFLRGLARHGHGIAEEQPLLPAEAADEALVMGLRLSEGIDADALARRIGVPEILDWGKVKQLCASGHLELEDRRVRASAAGRLVLDRVLAEIAVS